MPGRPILQGDALFLEAPTNRRCLLEALGIVEVDDQRRGVSRLKRIDEPGLHVFFGDRREVLQLEAHIPEAEHAGDGILGGGGIGSNFGAGPRA